jgi:hypothetical protein
VGVVGGEGVVGGFDEPRDLSLPEHAAHVQASVAEDARADELRGDGVGVDYGEHVTSRR